MNKVNVFNMIKYSTTIFWRYVFILKQSKSCLEHRCLRVTIILFPWTERCTRNELFNLFYNNQLQPVNLLLARCSHLQEQKQKTKCFSINPELFLLLENLKRYLSVWFIVTKFFWHGMNFYLQSHNFWKGREDPFFLLLKKLYSK